MLFASCSLVSVQNKKFDNLSPIEKRVLKSTNEFLNSEVAKNEMLPGSAIDTLIVNEQAKEVKLYFNKQFSGMPFRPENVNFFYTNIHKDLGRKFKKYSLQILTLDTPIEKLIPNIYLSKDQVIDEKRPNNYSKDVTPLVRRKDWKASPTAGLKYRNISVRHSHGWYYSNQSDRWEWQRPRLFQTVEDLFPTSFILPYLMPMLENAGANVFTPRERDWQTNEVVVDNDSSSNNSKYLETNTWLKGDDKGFALGLAPYDSSENPFRNGTYRFAMSMSEPTSQIEWIPNIPERGEYAVYISYYHDKNNITDAHYTVYHLGGKTEFLINQQIGGRTWIYLGKFSFAAGSNPDFCKVVLTNQSETEGKVVTADAVRFGGGMGDVERGGFVSRRPRFVEGARYYMQYAGMPDSIYNINNGENDYKDDYMARSEYENYLMGSPFGPNMDRSIEGLGIPVDLAFAFHTDAGITKDESVIGSLVIYSIKDAVDSLKYPDGVSRLANRDLSDIVLTEIVDDMREKYYSKWNRRILLEGGYSEAYRGNIPSMLVELLSHQNFQDMKYGLNPKFRFDVARSMYKGMLKFLANAYEFDYVVQPLPVDHFQAVFTGEKEVTLSWKPQSDPLEHTAEAKQYIVYTRINDLDFDNGQIVDENQCVMKYLEPGVQYSFKVTAVNEGGESFPTEVLSVCWVDEAKETVLIVNNFDRISAAEIIEKSDFRGFANFLDEGVPDKYDLGFTGTQHDFDSNSPWLTNDYPGWGASSADYETTVIAGNSFDYPVVHGNSIKNCGYSYVSCSDEAIESGSVNLKNYKIIDMIFGEEKSTLYSPAKDSIVFQTFSDIMKTKISDYLNEGGNIFMSGAYLGSDNFTSPKDTTDQAKFFRSTLKFTYDTDHASKGGEFFLTGDNYQTFHYNNEFSQYLYKLEAPDAISPAGKSGARTFLRFKDNSFSAGVLYNGEKSNMAIVSIPFETILHQSERDLLMKYILENINKN